MKRSMEVVKRRLNEVLKRFKEEVDKKNARRREREEQSETIMSEP